MPAVSGAQQRFFGYLKGNPAEAKRRGISSRVVDEFAGTKRTGLPEHVVKARRGAAARFARGGK